MGSPSSVPAGESSSDSREAIADSLPALPKREQANACQNCRRAVAGSSGGAVESSRAQSWKHRSTIAQQACRIQQTHVSGR